MMGSIRVEIGRARFKRGPREWPTTDASPVPWTMTHTITRTAAQQAEAEREDRLCGQMTATMMMELPDAEREARIVALGVELGVEIVFSGEYAS